ncbi:MAG: TonB-dependent receptor [bacterium]
MIKKYQISNIKNQNYCILVLAAIFISSVSFASVIPVFEGKEMIVTGVRIPAPILEAPSDVTVYTARDIEILGVESLADLLSLAPGVQVKHSGGLGNSSAIKVRGSTAEQVLFLLDGRRISSPLLGQVDLGDWLLDRIEKVEIVRGPASAVYGADAAFGVVNIITKTNKRTERYYLSSEGGTYGQMSYLLDGQTSWGDDDYAFSYKYLKSDGFRANNDYKAQDLHGSYNGNLSNGRFGFDFLLYLAKRGVAGSTLFPLTTARQDDNNGNFSLSWEEKNDHGIKAKVYQNITDQAFNFDPATMAWDNYRSWTTMGEISKSFELSRDNIFASGLEYRNDKSNSTKSGDHTVSNSALWLDDRIQYGALLFNLGGRYDSHSAYGGNFSPRIGVLNMFTNDLSMRVTYSQAFRAPTLNELYWNEIDPIYGTVTRGNTALNPEKTWMVDAGIRKEYENGGHISLSGYTSRVDNLIKWIDTSGTWSNWQTQNIAAAEFQGAEVDLVHVCGNLKGFANYSYQRAIDSSTGRSLTYAPKDKGNVGIEYGDNDFSLGATYSMIGTQYINESNTTSLKSFSVMDLSISKEFFYNYDLYIKSKNMFNESYQETSDYPMPGQTWLFGVKILLSEKSI